MVVAAEQPVVLGGGRLGEMCLDHARRANKRRRRRATTIRAIVIDAPDDEVEVETRVMAPPFDSQELVVTKPFCRRVGAPPQMSARPPVLSSVRGSAGTLRAHQSWVGPLVDEDHEPMTHPLPLSSSMPRRRAARPEAAMTLLSPEITQSFSQAEVTVTEMPFGVASAIDDVRSMSVRVGPEPVNPNAKTVEADEGDALWDQVQLIRGNAASTLRSTEFVPDAEPPKRTWVNLVILVAVLGLVAFAAAALFSEPAQRAALTELIAGFELR